MNMDINMNMNIDMKMDLEMDIYNGHDPRRRRGHRAWPGTWEWNYYASFTTTKKQKVYVFLHRFSWCEEDTVWANFHDDVM